MATSNQNIAQSSNPTNTRLWDQIGLSGSLICLVHCIATSGFLLYTTVAAHSHHHGHHHHHSLDFWGWMELGLLLMAGIAVYLTTRCVSQNKRRLMWTLFCIFFLTMISKYLGFEPLWLSLVSYASSFGLILAHLSNLKGHKHCSRAEHEKK